MPVKRAGRKGSKKPKRSVLNKRLETQLRIYIRNRDNNTCQHCYKPVFGSDSHVSHVVPKSAGDWLKYDEYNLKILCLNCHLHWWHLDPLEAAAWFNSKFPERAEYLERKKQERNEVEKKNQKTNWKDWEILELIEIYKGKNENLGNLYAVRNDF